MTLAETLRVVADMTNPENTFDLVALLIANLASIIAAIAGCSALIVALRGQRHGKARWAKDSKMLSGIYRQAVNDHPDEPDAPNLRDQIDRIETAQESLAQYLSGMRHWQTEQQRDIGGLRQDLGQVRGEVRDTRQELTDHRRDTRDFHGRITDFAAEQHPEAGPL